MCLTNNDEEKLRWFERKIIRTYGVRKEQEYLRELTNYEVARIPV